MSMREVCAFFGGPGQPIDPSTIYRWVRKGILAPPMKIGPKISRWQKSDCVNALERMREYTE